MTARPESAGGAGARRTRYGVRTAVLLMAVTVSCVLVAALGSRFHTRFDVTALRDFTLSERTRRVLDSFLEPATIIVSADLGRIDRVSRQRLGDVLAEFSKENNHVQSTWIDTGSGSAQAQFGALLSGLTQGREEAVAAQRDSLERIAQMCDALAGAMERLSDGLKLLSDALEAAREQVSSEDRTSPRNQAGLVRTIGSRLQAASDAVHAASANEVAGVALPGVDAAREAAGGPLLEAARAGAALDEYAGALARGQPGPVTEAAGTLQSEAASARDDAARAGDELSRLVPLDPLRVARALQASSAILVSSARGTLALDFQRVFPSGGGADPGATDTLFNGEQLIATALGTLGQRAAPILVFVHAQTARLLDDSGEPTPAARSAFGRLFERLRATRATPAEWAVATQATRPDVTPLDPKNDRPVVWVVLPAPSRSGIDPRQPGALAERNARITKLGDAVRTLVNAGESILMCIEPSDLPSLGEIDPIVAPLVDLGIKVDSARPILRRESSPQGALTYTFVELRRADEGHAIGAAIDGLGIVLPWAMPMELGAAPDGVRSWPLLRVPNPAAWGESQWTSLRDLVARGSARPLSPLLLADAPAPSADRDALSANGFIVAAAAERSRSAAVPIPHSSQTGPQRLVVVASPEWLVDAYTQASEDIAGRRAQLYPGNLELFDAATAWLAGLDEQIAPGPQARDVPRIGPIAEGPLRALRLFLIAGLPALVLIVGGLLRLLRG